jgi:glycerol uptake facilitator-like aquaporin
MDATLRRGLVSELLGTFAVVYFSAGAVCVNFLTTTGTQPVAAPLHALQPGLIGIALASGLIVAAALAVTVPLSGGFLNPAITLMLWVFNRLDNKRTALFLAAQLAGALLAGACLRSTFDDAVLRQSRIGTPHLNALAYPKQDKSLPPEISQLPAAEARIDTGTILAGTGVELILTFFLVFAIFAASGDGIAAARQALPAGLVLVAGAVVAGPLTGASANPARWFGTVIWEQLLPEHGNPWTDTFVYLAGPILGSLAAGFVSLRLLAADPLLAGSAKTSVAPIAARPAAMPAKKK